MVMGTGQVMVFAGRALKTACSRWRSRSGQGEAPAASSRPDALARRADVYKRAGVEPSLEELLRDPLVRMMMQADGLDHDAVHGLGAQPCAVRRRGRLTS